MYWHVILCPLVKQRVEINKNPYTIQRNVPKVQWSSIFSPLLSPRPLPLCPPPSLLCFFYKPTSTVSTPGITLQSTEERSNCIRQGENDSCTIICWIWAMVKCWTVFYTLVLSLSLDEMFGLTGVSTKANIWMKARVGLHQANKKELSCFMYFLNVLNTSRQIISVCSRERLRAEMCQCWQLTSEVCSSSLCSVNSGAVLYSVLQYYGTVTFLQ